MGCDIHSFAEQFIDGKWVEINCKEPFRARNYGVFAFLANVRNYFAITPISEPRGLPKDLTTWWVKEYREYGDYHTPSWLSIKELSEFNYDQEMEDRRVTRQVSKNIWYGAATAEPGKGLKMTYREFLGQSFFKDLQELIDCGAERVVFWFDN